MITSVLLVAIVAFCSATSSFGAPIPTRRASANVQALGRRTEETNVLERRIPRKIYFERYSRRDEVKVNINEVIARSTKPVTAAGENVEKRDVSNSDSTINININTGSVNINTQVQNAASTYNIHPSAASGKCVGIQGGTYADGSLVDIYDCNGSASQKWQWDGSALRSTNPADQSQWCLDAGEPAQMANGVKMKVWQCYGSLSQQAWKSPITGSTSSGNVALSVGGFCLDLTNGNTTNHNALQIWGCSKGDANQVWNFVSA